MHPARTAALALIISAITLAPALAWACSYSPQGVNRVTSDDSPPCLVFADTPSETTDGNLDVRNGCAYPVTLACAEGTDCSEWTVPTLDGTVVVEAGESTFLLVPMWEGVLTWEGEDGAVGTVDYEFDFADVENPCDDWTGRSSPLGCAATPGGEGDPSGWLSIGLFGLCAIRRMC